MAHRLFVLALLAVTCLAAPAAAQTPPAPGPAPAPRFGITDNSFLVEEAFNQDAGVFQNIFALTRTRDHRWDGSFTQEWPLGGMRHQASFTLPVSIISGAGEIGDVLVNYRLQVWTEGDRRPAFSPRLSVVFPLSPERRPFRSAGLGWQMNLPFSKEFGPLYFHANVGATWLKQPVDAQAASPDEWTSVPSVAGSAIWAARPMFNLMVEAVAQSASQIGGGRQSTWVIVPGFRTGWNFGERQVVIGIGAPITRGDDRDNSLLFYASLEMPFTKK